MLTRYSVRVLYVEPTYRRRPHLYTWTFEVDARSSSDAKRLALAEFDAMARLSSVGWVRELVGVECRQMVAEQLG